MGIKEILTSIVLSIVASAFYGWIVRLVSRPEVLRRQAQANQSIVDMLLPLVLARKLPSETPLAAYVDAVSKQYEVEPASLLTIEQIASVLVMETMGSVLLASDLRTSLADFVVDWRDQTVKNGYRSLIAPGSGRGLSPEFWRNVLICVVSFQTAFVLMFNFIRNGGTDRLFARPMAVAPILVVLLVTFSMFLFQLKPQPHSDFDPEKSLKTAGDLDQGGDESIENR